MFDEFKHSGLNATETQVLFYLLQKGPSSAGALAQNLKLKRTTIYSALENLVYEGLILKEKVGGKSVFVSVPADSVPKILTKKAETQLAKTKDAIALMQSRFGDIAGKNSVVFGGFEIQRLQTTSDYLNLLSKHIFTKDYVAIWNPEASLYSDVVKQRVAKFLDATAKRKNAILDIIPVGPKGRWYVNKIKNPNHKVKIIPTDSAKEIVSNMGIADLIVVEDLVIVSLNVPHNESALMIKSKFFADFMTAVFKSFWQFLPN